MFYNHSIMSDLTPQSVPSCIMLSQPPGLDFDKHSVYGTQGVQGRETESEEEAHLLRASVLCCCSARMQSVSKGRLAPFNTLAFK